MNMASPSKAFIVTVGILVALAGATVLVAQATVFSLEYKNEYEKAEIVRSKLISEEESKPRFVGDIGGLFLAPDDSYPVPDGHVSYESICGSERTFNVPWEEAGELDFRVDLPKQYVLLEDDMNTGAIACNGIVYAARRAYEVKLPNENSAYITIGRSILQHDTQDLAYDRPKLITINGQNVVIATTLNEDGSALPSNAWIIESFGDTFIMASGLPREDFLDLVAIVASSTQASSR